MGQDKSSVDGKLPAKGAPIKPTELFTANTTGESVGAKKGIRARRIFPVKNLQGQKNDPRCEISVGRETQRKGGGASALRTAS